MESSYRKSTIPGQLVWLAVVAMASVRVQTGVTAQTEGTQKTITMSWVSASNATALCNDYTRAGFFIRQNHSSRDWVVFLESGGLCYNTESCNRRFFVRQVRKVTIINDEGCEVSYLIIVPDK